MKKNKRTRLTALMFTAASVGCLAAAGGSEALYCVPAQASTEKSSVETVAVCRRLMEDMNLQVSESGELLGDVDGSGELNVVDLVALQRYLLADKVAIDHTSSDMNEDGEVDVFDLALLKRVIFQLQNEPAMPSVYGPPEWETQETAVPIYGPPEWFTDIEEETNTEPQDVYGPPEWFTDIEEPEEDTTEPTEDEEQWRETSITTEPTPLYGPPEIFDIE